MVFPLNLSDMHFSALSLEFRVWRAWPSFDLIELHAADVFLEDLDVAECDQIVNWNPWANGEGEVCLSMFASCRYSFSGAELLSKANVRGTRELSELLTRAVPLVCVE